MRLAGASGSARPKREPTSKETESAGLSETFLFSANPLWPLHSPHFRGRLGIAVGVEHHTAIADFDHIKTIRDGFLPLGKLDCLFPFHKVLLWGDMCAPGRAHCQVASQKATVGPDHLPRRDASKAARWRSHLGSRAIFRRPGSVRAIFSAVVIYKRYSTMAGAKCSRVMNWQMRAGETCPSRANAP